MSADARDEWDALPKTVRSRIMVVAWFAFAAGVAVGSILEALIIALS